MFAFVLFDCRTQRLTISGFFCPWGVLQRTLRIIVMVPKGRKKVSFLILYCYIEVEQMIVCDLGE